LHLKTKPYRSIRSEAEAKTGFAGDTPAAVVGEVLNYQMRGGGLIK
jgi:hypothetical protein